MGSLLRTDASPRVLPDRPQKLGRVLAVFQVPVHRGVHGGHDGRVVRKWRLAAVVFYGSLLAVLPLLANIFDQEVQVARTDSQANSRTP